MIDVPNYVPFLELEYVHFLKVDLVDNWSLRFLGYITNVTQNVTDLLDYYFCWYVNFVIVSAVVVVVVVVVVFVVVNVLLLSLLMLLFVLLLLSLLMLLLLMMLLLLLLLLFCFVSFLPSNQNISIQFVSFWKVIIENMDILSQSIREIQRYRLKRFKFIYRIIHLKHVCVRVFVCRVCVCVCVNVYIVY